MVPTHKGKKENYVIPIFKASLSVNYYVGCNFHTIWKTSV